MDVMTQFNNINIKLEVFKDKFTGNISLIAHFPHSAPNVYKENEDYVWFPTNEEKNFLIEAFDLTSKGLNQKYQDKTTTQPEPKPEVNSTVVTQTSQVVPKINIQYTKPQYTEKEVLQNQKDIKTSNLENTQKNSQSFNTYKVEEIKKENQPTRDNFPNPQPNEKVPTVYDAPRDIKTNDTKKDLKLTESYYKTNKEEELKKGANSEQTLKDKKDLDVAVISQVDIEAIDAALKKHNEKDEYIVQADEKTIVDKVLSQKKKGKWNKQ
jgi:hypothetical protein